MTVSNPRADVDLRRSTGDRVGIAVLAAVAAVGFAILAITGVLLLRTSLAAGIFLLACAAAIGAMLAAVWNEAIARMRTRIRVSGGQVALELPARRGYVKDEALDVAFPLQSVRAVKTRAEAFRSMGTTVIQRAYALELDDGRRVDLGADRRMVAPFFGEAAVSIAQAAGVPLTDLGTVDGEAGFLMLWGQTVPNWDAQPLAPAAAEVRVKQESHAWRLVWIAMGFFFLARLLAALLG